MLSNTPDVILSFGDSLSDSGLIHGITDQLLVAPLPFAAPPLQGPGYAGGFSDGPVFTQIFTDLLGADHYGFAAGGAEAIGGETVASNIDAVEGLLRPDLDPGESRILQRFDINFGAQVDRFLDGDPAYPGAPALDLDAEATLAATVFIGLNDLAAFASETDLTGAAGAFEALRFVLELGNGIADGALDLARSGLLDQMVVVAPPALSFFPRPDAIDEDAVEAADQFIEKFTEGLEALVDRLDRADGVEAVLLDLAPIGDEIMEDGRTFGLTAIGPFYEGTGTRPEIGAIDPATGLPRLSFPINPEAADVPLAQLRFFDQVHFSATTHGVIGAYTAAALTHREVILDGGSETGRTSDQPDLVLAGAGRDDLHLGRGADIALAGLGNDVLRGGLGNDLLAGGSGRDRLEGQKGHDLIAGGAGDDTGLGGQGRDVFLTGRGADDLRGGGGNDLFVFVDPAVTGLGARGDTDLRGGAGADRLAILTDPATTRLVRAELRAQKDAATVTLEMLGLTLTGIETVLVRGGGLGAIDSFNSPDILAEADLWGFV